MNKKNARDALDIYKRFLIRMDRVGEFLKVAEVREEKNAEFGYNSRKYRKVVFFVTKRCF